MTKGELLKILEPFNDDIKILVRSREDFDIVVQDVTAQYKIMTPRAAEIIRFDSSLENGEGYILIEEI